MTIVYAVLILGVTAVIFGLILACAAKVFVSTVTDSPNFMTKHSVVIPSL